MRSASKAVDVMDTLIRDRFARADRDALVATRRTAAPPRQRLWGRLLGLQGRRFRKERIRKSIGAVPRFVSERKSLWSA